MPTEVKIFFRVAFDLILESNQKIDDRELLTYLKANPKKDKEYRALPINYFKIIQILEKRNIKINSSILQDTSLSHVYQSKFKVRLELREYQEQALGEFLQNDGKGIIILPTAAGKTIIGLKAIEKLKQKTVIVVPTKNLLYQWIEHLKKYSSLTRDMIGQLGDQIREIK
ncbi:MAG: DEAD/DEAH box helicase family protein, partial [Candidatus Heimdallarchaeaceae archaeon]